MVLRDTVWVVKQIVGGLINMVSLQWLCLFVIGIMSRAGCDLSSFYQNFVLFIQASTVMTVLANDINLGTFCEPA